MAENIHLLPVFHTISLAWEKVKGAKKTIWAAAGIIVAAVIIFSFVQATLDAIYPGSNNYLKFGISLVFQLISYLLKAGIQYIGLQRAFDAPINYRMVFFPFRFQIMFKLLGLYILEMLILALIALPIVILVTLLNYLTSDMSKDFVVGLLFLILTFVFIYAAMRMFLAPGFVLMKNLNPVQALKFSFISTRSNFWRLFSINIIVTILILISIIPLLIGLIWTIPLMAICYGVIYKYLSANAPQIPAQISSP